MIYHYHVNLDERGSFYADVRDADENTIYEVKAGNELAEDESSIVEDGFMCDLMDTRGLTDYLRELGIIDGDSHIIIAPTR